ncbi:MAG TPA: hypothetical protein VFN35_11120 [Ktedonobacteraceae bacterium]|nr:hypothetical protein [Ktedonobacteraceae bacterium]
MNLKLQQTLDDASVPQPSRETLEKASRSVGRLGELISTRTSIAGNVTEKMTQAQLQELTSLENVLAKLARDLQLAQINAGSNFTRIDTTFKHLLHQVSGQSATLAMEAIETMNSPSEAEFQELLRQTGSFATEVNALTKRLAIIIQEMRTGIVPFRLEGSMNMDAHDLVKSAPGQPVSEARPTSSGNLISNR